MEYIAFGHGNCSTPKIVQNWIVDRSTARDFTVCADQFLVCGIRNLWSDTKLSLNHKGGSMLRLPNLGSIWYHSKPSKVPYFTNKNLVEHLDCNDTSSDIDLVNRKPKNDSYWISYANCPPYLLASLYFKVFDHSEMGNFNRGQFELHWSNSLFVEVFILQLS